MLDACLIINLSAAEAIEDLVAAEVRLGVVSQVAKEVLFLDDGEGDRQTVAVDDLLAAGHLELTRLSTAVELATMVGHVPRLGDGEAASLAAAASRGYVLATDDRLALRCAAALTPPVDCVTTPDILSWWADAAEVNPEVLAAALQRVERRACYVPPPAHSLASWWREAAELRLS